MRDPSKSSRRVLLFAKTPVAGKVKTRLAPSLGKHGALRAYRHLLGHTVEMLAASPFAPDVQVLATPQRFQRQFPSHAQGRGDLGARMLRAFAAGAFPALAIGTDCPRLNADSLASAFAKLRDADVVFGPALDGGYYLIGLKQRQPQLFRGIAWGTSAVLRQSLAIARRLRLKTALLPALSDVDSPRDWRGLALKPTDRH